MGIVDSQTESSRPADERAVERYRYLLRTAPPEDLERAHAAAFARLTAQQRQLILRALAREVSETEREKLTNAPASLARAATRTELSAPGTLERTLTPAGGNMFANLFSSLAGAFIGSALAGSMFEGLVAPPAAEPEPAHVDETDGDDFDFDA
ncbi:MAG: hypothetical protein JNK82_22575 [Myxococcaceae bacterium]|nr:hypothetical protein [Myxococcaceae bacterium]